jgi:hypothetical protein
MIHNITYHTILPIISELHVRPLISAFRDIYAMRYHRFDDIAAYVIAPARRDGAG